MKSRVSWQTLWAYFGMGRWLHRLVRSIDGDGGFHTKLASGDPSAVALESCEILEAWIGSVDTLNRAAIAAILYEDFVAANGFEPSVQVTVRFACRDKRCDLLNVRLRKLSGIRADNLNLRGASGDRNHSGENHCARHRPNETELSHRWRRRALQRSVTVS